MEMRDWKFGWQGRKRGEGQGRGARRAGAGGERDSEPSGHEMTLKEVNLLESVENEGRERVGAAGTERPMPNWGRTGLNWGKLGGGKKRTPTHTPGSLFPLGGPRRSRPSRGRAGDRRGAFGTRGAPPRGWGRGAPVGSCRDARGRAGSPRCSEPRGRDAAGSQCPLVTAGTARQSLPTPPPASSHPPPTPCAPNPASSIGSPGPDPAPAPVWGAVPGGKTLLDRQKGGRGAGLGLPGGCSEGLGADPREHGAPHPHPLPGPLGLRGELLLPIPARLQETGLCQAPTESLKNSSRGLASAPS